MCNIVNQKVLFLDKYNPEREVQRALSMSIKASVQRNNLYSENIRSGSQKRIEVGQIWREKLIEITKKYENSISRDQYLEDVVELKKFMNETFDGHFNNNKFLSDPGLRLSHSQKSISVYLKHLWCIGKVKEPPCCPVDAIILKRIGLKYPHNSWGKINQLQELEDKLNLIEKFASKNSLSVAQWELCNF